jgi:7-cyano-7-deazaguanine reductase
MPHDQKNSRNEEELKELSLGSSQTNYPTTYAPEVLEVVANHAKSNNSWASFICNEFTSLCPKTAQPDFAKITINYIPNEFLVESKSLKLYLFSFRNHGDFHEDCIDKIARDLQEIAKPKFIEVIGEFTPRGGICIYPYSSYSNGDKNFEELKLTRFLQYSPGKYTL